MKWTIFLFSIRIFSLYFTHENYMKIFKSNKKNFENLMKKNKSISSFQVNNTRFQGLARHQLISVITDLIPCKTNINRIAYTEIELNYNIFWKYNYNLNIQKILYLNTFCKEDFYEYNYYFNIKKNVLKNEKNKKFDKKLLEENFKENIPIITRLSKKSFFHKNFSPANLSKIHVFNLENEDMNKEISVILENILRVFINHIIGTKNRNPENLLIVISPYEGNFCIFIQNFLEKLSKNKELLSSTNSVSMHELKTHKSNFEIKMLSTEYIIVFSDQNGYILDHMHYEKAFFQNSFEKISKIIGKYNIEYSFSKTMNNFTFENITNKTISGSFTFYSKFKLKCIIFGENEILNEYEIIFSKITDIRNRNKFEGEYFNLKIRKIITDIHITIDDKDDLNEWTIPDNGRNENININSDHEFSLNNLNIPGNEDIGHTEFISSSDVIFDFTYNNLNLYSDRIHDNIKNSEEISNYKKTKDLLFFLKFIVENHEFLIFKKSLQKTLSVKNDLCYWRNDIFITFITLSQKLNIIHNSIKYNKKDNFKFKKVFLNKFIYCFDYDVYKITLCEYENSKLFKKKSQLQIFDNYIGHYFYKKYTRFIYELQSINLTNYCEDSLIYDFLIILKSSSNATKYHVFLTQVDNHEVKYDLNINQEILFFELKKIIGKVFYGKFEFYEDKIINITKNLIKQHSQNLASKLFEYAFLETFAFSFFKITVKEIYECKKTKEIYTSDNISEKLPKLNELCSNKILEFIYNGLIYSMRKSIIQRKYNAVVLPSIFLESNDSKEIIDFLKKD